jgi:hypothetical protein
MSVPTAGVWDRRAWAAGIVFVLALLADAVISAGTPINQDDSAAKIARALQDDRKTVLFAGYLSAVYAVAFVIYLAKLHDRLRGVSQRRGVLHSLVLIGGVLMVALHGATSGSTGCSAASWRRTPRNMTKVSRTRCIC